MKYSKYILTLLLKCNFVSMLHLFNFNYIFRIKILNPQFYITKNF